MLLHFDKKEKRTSTEMQFLLSSVRIQCLLLCFPSSFSCPCQSGLKHHLPSLQLIWGDWLSCFKERLGSLFMTRSLLILCSNAWLPFLRFNCLDLVSFTCLTFILFFYFFAAHCSRPLRSASITCTLPICCSFSLLF